MKKNYASKIFILVVLAFTICDPIGGQAQQLGISGSNFMGTHALYRNPSAIADARQSFYLNLFSFDAGVTNNFLRYDSPTPLIDIFRKDLPLEEQYLKENLNGRPKLFSLTTEFRGPSLMIRLSPKHSIGLTTRFRGGVQLSNVSEDFARLYKVYEGSNNDLVDKLSDNNNLNLNANLYSEMGLSYARVVFDREKHFLKAGVTLKKLSGGFSAHLINEDTQYTLREDAANNKILEIDRINARYGYNSTEDELDKLENLETPGEIMSFLLGRNSPGKGWGGDIGVTYEYRPKYEKYRAMMDGKEEINHRKNKYKYRVGISLMDVGSINYKNSANITGYQVERTNKSLALDDFGDAESVEEAAEVLNDALDITAADKITSYRTGLPTTLNINLDYKIAGPLYANASWIQDLRGKSAISMRQFSLLAVTPRLEFRALEIAVPVSLQNNYSVLSVGAMVKVGPFFVGSDNIGGALNMGTPYGANVYTGLAFSFANKRNKDKDKDGVSDRIDKCKKIPGTWELMGCPPPVETAPAPVVTPTQPEINSPVDSAATPAPDSLLKATDDTLSKPMPDSLSKPIPDSLQIAPQDSLNQKEPASFNRSESAQLYKPGKQLTVQAISASPASKVEAIKTQLFEMRLEKFAKKPEPENNPDKSINTTRTFLSKASSKRV